MNGYPTMPPTQGPRNDAAVKTPPGISPGVHALMTSAQNPRVTPVKPNPGVRAAPGVMPVKPAQYLQSQPAMPVQPGQAQEFMQPKPMQIDPQPGRFQNQYGRFRGMAQAAAPQDFSYGGNGGGAPGLSPQLANRLRAFREF